MIPLALSLLQKPCDVFLVDSAGDQLVRLVDLDGDARVAVVHEAAAAWRSSSPLTPRALDFAERPAPPLSASSSSNAKRLVAYWVDSTGDLILCGTDVNDNGIVEPFEEAVYRDSGQLDGASRPLGLAATTDGAVWWCSDEGFAGLFRCADLDGDGLAAAPHELARAVDGSAGPHPVEVDGGSALCDSGHLVRLADDGDLVVAYVEGADEAAFAFRDANRDGDVRDPGESRLFLNASGKNPALPQNADWASGALRELAIPAAAGALFYGRLSHLAVASEGPASAWYFACDSHALGSFATNVYGHGLNGLVFRGVDANEDGDLQEAGEVRLFYDGSHTSLAPLAFEQIVGIDACGGALYVAYLEGAAKRVARLADENGDGDAFDPGEIDALFFDSDEWSGKTPFAAAPPFVQDITALDANRWADANALFEVSGAACSLTQSGALPVLSGRGHARLGTNGFTCELRNALAGTWALLCVGDDSPGWMGLAFPIELSIGGYAGCYLHMPMTEARWLPTQGPPGDPTAGYAAHAFDVPDFPELEGKVFRLQWMVPDFYNFPYQGGLGLAMTARGQIAIEP